jgi:hypothetical protein
MPAAGATDIIGWPLGRPASKFYFLCIVFMHLAQAFTLLPEPKRTHCKLGCFLTFAVGLYFPLNLTRVVDIIEPLPQIEHFFIGF